MKATATSKLAKAIWALKIKGRPSKGVTGVAEVNKVINKWPAIILAANRIAKVSGRIIFLIVSITTIKGIKIVGVPFGIKWINKLEVLKNQP